jgi:D-alanyl-D-alanine carboxypeptidase/D-alanyl-D-alanine-endopeptidase (penicillin-binding protein 4)
MRRLHPALLCATTFVTVIATALPASSMLKPTWPALARPAATAPVAARTHQVAPRLTAVQRQVAGALRSRVLTALRASTASSRGVQVHVSGIGIVVRGGDTLPLRPASTEKLYTAVATLLGDAARPLRTEVRGFGTLTGGVLYGDLVLRGTGDPSLSGRDLGRLAAAVRAHGIRVVRGGLWGDDTTLDRGRSAPGWKPDFMPDESGPLSALVVDRNGWRDDAAYLRNPVPGNLDKFRRALGAAGVRVVGGNRIGRPSRPTSLLGLHQSASVASLVRHALKVSDNMYAEQLLKVLGATQGDGSTTGGLAAVRATAARLHVGVGRMVDGSGLSAYDRQTAAGEVAWLESAAHTPAASTLRSALPIACHDGTLKRRLCGTVAAGRVWAKTGTLDHVTTLAGYTHTRTGRLVTFSIMLSGVRDMSAGRAAIDRAVLAMVTSRL